MKKSEEENAAAEAPISSCFIDREQSWLQFDLRVLEEAGRSSVPLLERLKFLGIYYSNLDEFFMVRVGSLMHRAVVMPDYRDPKTGWSTAYQIKQILRETEAQQARAEEIWRGLLKDLADAGIDVLDFHRLSKVDEVMTRKIFADVRPLLEPHIVDERHPMPFLGNKDTWIAASIGAKNSPQALGLVSLTRLPKFRTYDIDGRQKVVILSHLVRHYVPQLFKHFDVRDACEIRVTRNADVFIEENSGDKDFRASMQKLLRKRKREMPVRLQITGHPSQRMLDLLTAHIPVSKKHIFQSSVPHNVSFASSVAAAPDMKYDERRSVRTVQLHKGEYFRYLQQNDLLLSFPYQSITPFIEMLYEAADDPDVVSIRITLYRLAASSKVAAALAYAADQGKDVLCLLELRARFDEQNNIDYSEVLEDAGCQVIYGLPEQKVHSKLCLITRRSGAGVSYITQVGTGNYNEQTSEQYCDLSLITANRAIGEDAAAIFDRLALGLVPDATDTLIIAPLGFKPRILDLLEQQRRLGPQGFVSIKVNSVNDIDIMTKLIECSQAGVPVELFVRGICCLRPGVPGCTETVTVRSVVGRYLEHSRIFVFGTGAQAQIYIGSGDLLNRNTRRRVEAFIPVTTEDTRRQVLEVMDAFRCDREKGSIMLADGSYIREKNGRGTSSQERLWKYFSQMTVSAPTARKRRGLFARLFRRGKKK